MVKHLKIGLVEDSHKKQLLTQRITLPPSHTVYDNKTGNAETVMSNYVNTNIVNPLDANRKIPRLIAAPNQNSRQSIF
ncbi:Gp37-like protein [Metabacillus endolithicus]